MESTDELVNFLRARLDEDERTARDAAAWWEASSLPGEAPYWRYVSDMCIKNDRGISVAHEVMHWTAAHIARHDPAHVLVDVKAKRRLVELHTYGTESTRPDPDDPDDEGSDFHYCLTCGGGQPHVSVIEWPCETLLLIVQPYADHPEFREGWRL